MVNVAKLICKPPQNVVEMHLVQSGLQTEYMDCMEIDRDICKTGRRDEWNGTTIPARFHFNRVNSEMN